jgi:general secretion pathway protein A
LKSQYSSNDRHIYQEVYGFSEDPFALNPDPKFLYPGPTHSEVLSTMVSGIMDRRGIIVITGEAGVGKTILVYALLRDRSERIRTAFIFNPNLDLKSILENIFQDLGLPIQEKGGDLFSLLVGFRETLKESINRSETLAIVVDEAQSLAEEVLEGLFRLATPDSPDTNALQIVLVGHPDLEKKLNSERFNPYKGRITVKERIRPLSRQESRDYITYRLNLVGRNITEVFTAEGINMILRFANGNPRVINLLCSRALSAGCQAYSPLIDSKIVKKATKELKHLRIRKAETSAAFLSLPKKSLLKILRILFFAFSAVVFFLSLWKIIPLLLQK